MILYVANDEKCFTLYVPRGTHNIERLIKINH